MTTAAATCWVPDTLTIRYVYWIIYSSQQPYCYCYFCIISEELMPRNMVFFLNFFIAKFQVHRKIGREIQRDSVYPPPLNVTSPAINTPGHGDTSSQLVKPHHTPHTTPGQGQRAHWVPSGHFVFCGFVQIYGSTSTVSCRLDSLP